MPYRFVLPIITELTIPQQAVLNEVSAIAVKGGPGTGKSVVSLWRHIQNYDLARRKSLLLSYNVCLEHFLTHTAKTQNIECSNHISRTLWWLHNNRTDSYDEIIVDEAQDVELRHYTTLLNYVDNISFCADNNQQMYNGCTFEELQQLLNNRVFELTTNFRSTKQLNTFVRSFFNELHIPEVSVIRDGVKPQLVCTNGNHSIQLQIIKDVIAQFSTQNIAILTPLITSALHRERTVRSFYNELNGININGNTVECSYYENQQNNIQEISSVHISTLKSAKGLEFDTVIIPDFDLFQKDLDNLYTVEKGHYYVAFTRAKQNLILIDNSSLNGTGNCNLSFIQNQINHSIVDIDYSYCNKTDNKQEDTPPSIDDLPF